MTVEVSHDNPGPVTEPAASSNTAARHHLAASLGFMLVGVLMLAVASIQFVSPDLLSGWAPLSYGRLRPAAIHFLLYGWLTLGLIGAMYYAVPRLSGVPLTDPNIARIGFVLMSVGYAVGGIGILLGQSEGYRYLEAPPVADVIVLVGMMAMSHSIARTIARRDRGKRSPAEWFMLAAVIWLVGLHVIGNLGMISLFATIFWSQPPVLHGINAAVLAGFYRAGIVGLWGATAGVGLVYFLVPRLLGLSNFKPTRMSLVGFWGLGIAWAFTGSAELTFTAIPDWLETIGIIFSMAVLLPVATIIIDITTVLRGRAEPATGRDRSSLSLVYLGLGLFAALPILNLLEALRASGGVVGFTDWVYGVEVVALLGVFSSWLVAYVYHVTPRTVAADAPRIRKWHLRLTAAGLAVAVFAMLMGGVVAGFTWAGGESGGAVAVGDAFEPTADAMWHYGFAIARMAGLMLFTAGQILLFAFATVAWLRAPDRKLELAADELIDGGSREVNEELALDAASVPGWRRIVGGALVGAIGAFVLVVVLPAQEIESADPSILADTARIYVDGSDVEVGRDIYIGEGCSTCHTQAVRPIVTDVGLGPVSVAGDYAHEDPVLLGAVRMGPDLMHVGSRGAIRVEQLTHPRAARPWSTMPSYDYLSEADLAALVAYVNGLK